jgi:chromosome partitioning protein
MYTIAVVNQKGGCGKTTTAANLAAGLAARSRRTLLVDLDPQAHASLSLGHIDDGSERSLYDVVVDPLVPITQILAPVAENLDLAPGSVILHAAEQVLAGAAQRENRLRRKLESIASQYHYVIIDSPPAVGLLTVNALSAADLALVTVEASYLALHGMARLFETIRMVRRETGREVAVRALCTMFDGRTRHAQEVYDEIRRHLGDTMYKTIIRVNVKLREAASHGKSIFAYASHAKGAEDYGALADEVLAAEARIDMDSEAAVSASDDLAVNAAIAEGMGASAPTRSDARKSPTAPDTPERSERLLIVGRISASPAGEELSVGPAVARSPMGEPSRSPMGEPSDRRDEGSELDERGR